MNTFSGTDFGLSGERRLALEPALLAVILAGGAGTFIHYELPGSSDTAQTSAWRTSAAIDRAAPSPAAIAPPALPLAIGFGASPAQPRPSRLQSVSAPDRRSSEVATAIRLDQRPAASGSFLSRLNGSAARQDYVIRLTFPEPAAADLAVVAMPARGTSAALPQNALAIAGSVPPAAALGLVDDGIAGAVMGGLDPAAVAEIQTARLAELQQAGGAKLQHFAGLAPQPLDGLKFDLAALPSSTWHKTGATLGSARTRSAAATELVSGSDQPAPAGLKPAVKSDRIVGEFIFHQAAVQLNERQAGRVDVRIGGDTSLSIQISALLAIVEGKMDPAAFAALSGSASAAEYVSFREIRDAGIGVRYDAAANRIVFTAD